MRPSIQRRLLVLTTVVITTVVGLVAWFTWWRMDRARRDDLDQTLRTQALTLAGQLEDEDGRIEFDWEGAEGIPSDLRGDWLAQVIALNGRILFSPPVLKPCPTFSAWLAREASAAPVQWFDADLPVPARRYRVVALLAQATPSDERATPATRAPLRAWVFVARPLAPLEAATQQLAWTLLAAGLLATIAALAGSFYIARSATRPILAVAGRIAEVEPGHPRLDLEAWRTPVELDPIVLKTDVLLRRIAEELARQRQLTADIAHDLRTPVAGVRTLLEVCVQRERTAREYLETIGAAQAALRQLSTLLDHVLTLARLDLDAERPVSLPMSIADVIAEAMTAVRPLALARDVDVACTGDGHRVIVSDAAMLLKILTNILANAVEHSPPRSSVNLVVEPGDERITLHVKDHGPGIPVEQQERIFDRFVRGDQARTESGGHNGLGLPIARGLARLLGGDVHLDSQEGLGSDFMVVLPMSRTADHD